MGDVPNPYPVSPPPPTSPPPPLPNIDMKSNMPMVYYGLVVVGTAAIVLAVYNLIIIKRNRRQSSTSSSSSSSQPPNRLIEIEAVAPSRSFEISLHRNLLSSFKYKKEAEGDGDGECPVCLSRFEEGEEVRKLPRCRHWFHAACIDMWLYSHFDCPICRTPVMHFFQRFPAPENSNSGEGLLQSTINGVAV